MIDVFGTLKSLVKVETVAIDNNVFRLHYKATVLFLIASSILVASRQYFGDPIDCVHSNGGDLPANVLDTFCWIHPTFTLPDAFDKKIGVDVPHPGIDKYKEGDAKVHHSYYQWVSFVLFLQAACFYVPRYLWKVWEGGKVKALILNLDSAILKQEQKEEQKELLVSYLANNINNHSSYLARFALCEVLNLVNIAGQMFVMDRFLGGVFTTFGTDVVRYMNSEDQMADPMVRVFPRVTKCIFRRFGQSGSLEKVDALCILPLNIINEKIYIFLWFWFVVLITLTCLTIVYRMSVIFAFSVRYYFLKAKAPLTDSSALHSVLQKTGAGGWFLLSLLCKNMDPVNFKDVVDKLAEELQGYRSTPNKWIPDKDPDAEYKKGSQVV